MAPDIDIPGASVLSFSAAEVADYKMSSGPTVSFCDVNVSSQHGWRQATGGGGFIAGAFSMMLVPAVASGYAAASTDVGLSALDGSELIGSPQLIANFASLSLHEMAVVGKFVTEWFYEYTDHFDGILALAPAIAWDGFMTMGLYLYVVMTLEGEIVPAGVFDTFEEHAIAFCDADDGAEDGVISDPENCKFDAKSVVYKYITCKGNSHAAVPSLQARIYNLIVDGFVTQNETRLCYILMPGTDFSQPTHDPKIPKHSMGFSGKGPYPPRQCQRQGLRRNKH